MANPQALRIKFVREQMETCFCSVGVTDSPSLRSYPTGLGSKLLVSPFWELQISLACQWGESVFDPIDLFIQFAEVSTAHPRVAIFLNKFCCRTKWVTKLHKRISPLKAFAQDWGRVGETVQW